MKRTYLHIPHFPPSFAQCLQYLQFLHALQGSDPVQVDEGDAKESSVLPKMTTETNAKIGALNFLILSSILPPRYGSK